MSNHASIRLFPFGRFEIRLETDPTVRVPDVVLKCVAFIGEVTSKDADVLQGDLLATGFFVSLPSSIPGAPRFCYFVTAKHVAGDLAGRTPYFLVNSKNGGLTTLESYSSQWWFHPSDQTADVAVIPCTPHPDMDTIAIPISRFATPDVMDEREIGVGDEVFTTGLFTPAQGEQRNVPIVRHGNIAMLPATQIQTEMGFADVILVEARSIGGLSGSPVFVRETVIVSGVHHEGREPGILAGAGQMYLLGLMHGHWDVRESELNSAIVSHDSKRGVNMGIAIVVPAVKIMETLNQKDLADMRTRTDKKNLPKPPKMDMARAPIETEMFTKQDFESALRRVSRRTQASQSDEEK